MTRVKLLLAALLALLLPAAAQADVTWGGTAEARVGYGTNPFLYFNRDGGAGLAGFTVAPEIDLREPTSTTTLAGSYNRDQYFSKYGHADDYGVDLRRTQQFNAKLTGTAHVGYFSAISGLLSPYYTTVVQNTVTPGATTIDALSAGTRQQRIFGDVGLQYNPTSRDSFNISGVAQRYRFSRFFGGDYSYLGATAGYSRAVDARTRVGIQVTGGHVYSNSFPDSSSFQPSATLQRTLSAHWTFNGSLGAIIQQQRYAGRDHTSVSPGFTASLCNKRARLDLCATASRQSATSGLGGLRRDTQFGVEGTYRLSERSRVIGSAVYGISDATERVVLNNIAYGNQRYAFARVTYQRDLSRRLAAGVSGFYQERSGAGLPNVHALAITFNLTAKFGHTAS